MMNKKIFSPLPPRIWGWLAVLFGLTAMNCDVHGAEFSGLCRGPNGPLVEQEFAGSPPDWAKPHIWWHWMNGNITREGITADLEAMKRVGLGGAQIFNVDTFIPAGPVEFLSDTWRDMVQHAVREAQRLGLELCIHNCPGWSSSGGPWVKPECAMLMVTTSELGIVGPQRFSGPLPQPEIRCDFYRDIAVLAFPTPGGCLQADTLRLDNLEAKAAYVRAKVAPPTAQMAIPADKSVPQAQIMDLTDKLGADGHLNWEVPEGSWTIIRLGYTPTGMKNQAAPRSGLGLDVDKMSRSALDAFWDGMMQTVINDAGSLAGSTLNNVLIDSYEVGCQNWTPAFRQEFQSRRGYDLWQWLPCLTGHVINSLEESERFLWDYRRTIAELFRDNYYNYFVELCHKHGLLASVQPYGDGPFDDLSVGKAFDIPMGEFWLGQALEPSLKTAASVAHTCGRPIVGAESFTAEYNVSGWRHDPYALKLIGDRVFCTGINRYIFHRYAAQPWLDQKPGMTLGPYGLQFERTLTWWEQSTAWLTYVARCQYLLQQGRFFADVCYYVGEDSPVSLKIDHSNLPAGFDYDGLSVEQLLNDLSVRKGCLVLPSGMSYRVLVLPDSHCMTPQVVAKVRQLVAEGATVLGPRPVRSPSLVGYPACDRQVQQISREVWGDTDGQAVTEHVFGKGRVFWGVPLEQVLTSLQVKPDFEVSPSRHSPFPVHYIHRVKENTDIYFVANSLATSNLVECTFNVAGKRPELWDPLTGRIEPAPIFCQLDGRTRVPLRFDPVGSIFVVFRHPIPSADHIVAANIGGVPVLKPPDPNDDLKGINPHDSLAAPAELHVTDDHSVQLLAWRGGNYEFELASGKTVNVQVAEPAEPIEIAGPWQVSFPSGLGAPDRVILPKLISWTDHALEGVKYFSGTATYRQEFGIPASWLSSDRHIWLDLGGVKNLARLRVNGTDLGILWKPPFATEVTDALKPGLNRIEIEITNLWINRLIGDERYPDDCSWSVKPQTGHPEKTRGYRLDNWPDWLLEHRPRPSAQRVTFATWKFWKKDDPLVESGLLGPVKLLCATRVTVPPVTTDITLRSTRPACAPVELRDRGVVGLSH